MQHTNRTDAPGNPLTRTITITALSLIAIWFGWLEWRPPAGVRALEDQLRRAQQQIEGDPHDMEGHRALCEALVALGRVDEALAAHRRALVQDEGSAWALLGLGWLLAKSGDANGAREICDRLLTTSPADPEAHYLSGVLWWDQGLLEHAEREFVHSLALNEKGAESHTALGALLDEVGRNHEALPHHVRAIEIDSNCALAHSDRGSCLWALGRRREALLAFERAAELDPSDMDTIEKLSYATNWLATENLVGDIATTLPELLGDI